MKTYTIYRTYNGLRYGSCDTYTPVRRGGKPVTFKTKREAEKWIEDNPVKTTAPVARVTKLGARLKGQSIE